MALDVEEVVDGRMDGEEPRPHLAEFGVVAPQGPAHVGRLASALEDPGHLPTARDHQTAPVVVKGPRREWRKPKPMMNGLKKSDEAIRPVRAANKGARASAESPEERASTKGNSDCQSTRRTQRRASVTQAAARIRKAAERNPKERLTALFHHITPDALHRAFHALRRDAAAGVDGITWDMYGEGLEERLLDLHRRLHRGGAYRAPPVRRVEIPKPDGGTRPLGIAALEDKVVQKAVVDVILTPIYEVVFLGFSYGFRPGRGAHDALDALAFGIERRKVSWIVDADLRAYFDTIPRDWLITFLEHRIGDRRVIRLIRKWLNAGVIESGSWADTGMGTPQGAIVSPVLANVFLHYVLDLWFHKKWRPNVPDRLGRISKRGDGYIRRLLVHGARTVLRWRRAKPGTGPGWTDRLLARRPTNVVLVAMANKTARVAWALLRYERIYRPTPA